MKSTMQKDYEYEIYKQCDEEDRNEMENEEDFDKHLICSSWPNCHLNQAGCCYQTFRRRF